MTQLMLFDAPASVSVATPVVAAAANPSVANQPAREQAPSSNRQPAASRVRESRRQTRQPATGPQRGGMHHMGDLARLVLMRYEMVHRRRAALAQRQASCAG